MRLKVFDGLASALIGYRSFGHGSFLVCSTGGPVNKMSALVVHRSTQC